MAEGAAVLRQKVAETVSRLEESDQSVSSEGNCWRPHCLHTERQVWLEMVRQHCMV